MTLPLIVTIGKLSKLLGMFNNSDFEVFNDSLLSLSHVYIAFAQLDKSLQFIELYLDKVEYINISSAYR